MDFHYFWAGVVTFQKPLFMRIFSLPDFINLFFPEVCAACNNGLFRGERVICTHCLYHLPRTGFHLHPGNLVEKQFWGKVPVRAATALFYFHKGQRVQHLIHRLKYHGEKDVGVLAGEMLGTVIKSSGRFSGLDAVVPVPLHAGKLRTRGFNQSDLIARGIAETLRIPVLNDCLVRNKATSTQTRKSRYQRFENVDCVFGITDKYAGKPMHYLIADDVITTGSTLASCAAALLDGSPDSSVSIATVAYASLI